MLDNIDGYELSHLHQTARRAVTSKTADSLVLDVRAEYQIPKFDAAKGKQYTKSECGNTLPHVLFSLTFLLFSILY